MNINDLTIPEKVEAIVFPETFTEFQQKWARRAIAISAQNEYPLPMAGEVWAKVTEDMKPSQIAFLRTEMIKAAGSALPPLKIYIRWDMNADSWTGTRTMLSIHQTLDGAITAVPKNIRNDVLERPANDHYVKNYTYEAIEEREIGA